ncbi:hypothetical protein CSW98_06420 [Vibrio sp. HA2012]|uniref:carbohydrate porin n=1 Tax=Vibrio sp. HA2012 TaxID=1971595 RepID=UPI000C2B762A|nr:carbohydrate porin [Vibrio sp. HA2012]PJC86631.1 hypothetical protein CSW98_06420 [Vibrio sp. HA2012]
MKKWELSVALSLMASMSAAVSLPVLANDANDAKPDSGFEVHGFAKAAGDFESELDRAKTVGLHYDPDAPNQKPRGKFGKLGNDYWHDLDVILFMKKKWNNIFTAGEWADFTYQVEGYGDGSIDSGQAFVRFGGLPFLDEGATVWAGRRNFDHRLRTLAYAIEEAEFDSGVGYNSKNFDFAVGTNQVNYTSDDHNPGAIVASEGTNSAVDTAYRFGNAELGLTYVRELDSPLGFTEKQQAISVKGKYKIPGSFFGMFDGRSLVELQAGKGVLAQYLNTSRITVLSEEEDTSMRLTFDGSITEFEGWSIDSTLMYEFTDRQDDREVASLPDTIRGGTTYFGSADETGIFGDVTVSQAITDHISLTYEANYMHSTNKDGVDGVDGSAYKLAFGPTLQLKSHPRFAPQVTMSVAYFAGDEEVTYLDSSSEVRFGYQMQLWF